MVLVVIPAKAGIPLEATATDHLSNALSARWTLAFAGMTIPGVQVGRLTQRRCFEPRCIDKIHRWRWHGPATSTAARTAPRGTTK